MNGPLNIRDCQTVWTVTDDDSDVVLRFEESGSVSVPADAAGVPVGFQFAIESIDGTVVLRPEPGVTVVGPSTLAVGPLKTGVFVKQNSNFWLMSLGQGSSGGGQGGAEGTPDRVYAAFDPTFTAISWAPITGTAGPTLGYGAGVLPVDSCRYKIDGTVLNIEYVTAGIPISFEVWGVNCNGKGVSSDPLLHTWPVLGVPEIAGTPGPASAQLTWAAVPTATAYMVQYRKKGDATWLNLPAGNVTTYSVQGLNQEVPFQFQVLALLAPAASAPSNLVEVTPGPGAVDQPVAERTAQGQWQITNYDPTYIYAVTGPGGINAAGLVSVTDPDGIVKVGVKRSVGAPEEFIWLERRHITTHNVNVEFTQAVNPCGNCGPPEICGPCTGPGCGWGCGCGSGCDQTGGGAWGCCICRGPGYSYPVNDDTPPGYAASEGEWWRQSYEELTKAKKLVVAAPLQGFYFDGASVQGWLPMTEGYPYGASMLTFTSAGKRVGVFCIDTDVDSIRYHSFNDGQTWMKFETSDVSWLEGADLKSLGYSFQAYDLANKKIQYDYAGNMVTV